MLTPRPASLLPVIFLTISVIVTAQAQPKTTPYLQDAERMKTLFKDQDVAALESTASYTVSLNPGKTLLQATCELSARYISLKANITAFSYTYFTDRESIQSYSIKSDNGRAIRHDKFCGHYEQDGIFYSDAQVCSYRWQMPLPGQLAHVETVIRYNDSRYLTALYFNERVPSEKRIIRFTIPDWADIQLKEVNFEGYGIQKTSNREGNSTVYTYTLKNARAFPRDENLPGYSHFLPHILVLTRSITVDGKQVPILSNVNDLYRWYQELTIGMKSNPEALKPKVNEIINGLTSDEARIKALYYWVQDNIKYIAFEDGVAAFRPEDSDKVLYNRYGDCKGMANLLKDMLLAAGYDARLTWIGTDRIAYTFDVPTLAVNNHMICTVFLQGKKLILDPTEKFGAFREMAERIQSKEVLIENGKEFILEKVPQEPLEYYLEESVASYKINNNMLVGTGTETLHGEERKRYLNLINAISNDKLDKFLKWLVAREGNTEHFTVTKPTEINREQAINIRYEVNASNQVYQHGKELYLDLDLRDDFKNSRIEKGRYTPYKFTSRTFQKSIVELEVPTGFTVAHLPEAYTFTNGYFSFSMKYSTQGNKLIYQKDIRILNSIMPATEFANWNAAIDGVRKFYNDQIILKSND